MKYVYRVIKHETEKRGNGLPAGMLLLETVRQSSFCLKTCLRGKYPNQSHLDGIGAQWRNSNF